MSESIQENSAKLLEVISRPRGTTFEGMVAEMEVIDPLLAGSRVAHTSPFHRGYLKLSRRINERNAGQHPGKKGFLQPETLGRTANIFANYWYQPVANVLRNETPPIAWHPPLRDPRARRAHPGICFLLCMGTHIKRDLPLVLASSLRDPAEAEAYLADYQLVDELIYETAHGMSDDYIPVSNDRLRGIITDLTVDVVADWRDETWRNYERLEACEGDQDARQSILNELDMYSIKTSERILTTGRRALGALSIPQQFMGRLGVRASQP